MTRLAPGEVVGRCCRSPSDRRLGTVESVVLLAAEPIQYRVGRAAKRLKSSIYAYTAKQGSGGAPGGCANTRLTTLGSRSATSQPTEQVEMPDFDFLQVPSRR